MPNKYGSRTYEEGQALENLIKKSLVYLNNVFHKLKPDKRFYLALEIIKKRIPTDVKHTGSITVNLNDLTENVLNSNVNFDTREKSRLN